MPVRGRRTRENSPNLLNNLKKTKKSLFGRTFSNNQKPNQIMKKSIVNSRAAVSVLRVATLAVLLGSLPFMARSQAQESSAQTEQASSQQQGEQAAVPKHKDKTFF